MATVKKSAAPKATKTVKSEAAKPVKKADGLTIAVMTPDGKSSATMTLPKEVFGVSVPATLLAQAVRVYLINQREGSASTKTRGEVEGSTRKIYKQKGTGKARHGSIRAHIFVGGGVAFGPRPHEFHASLSTNMKRKALAGALTQQLNDGNVIVADGFEKLTPKTKPMHTALKAVGMSGRTLLVTGSDKSTLVQAAGNIKGIEIESASTLTTYSILSHAKVIFMKSAVEQLVKRFIQ